MPGWSKSGQSGGGKRELLGPGPHGHAVRCKGGVEGHGQPGGAGLEIRQEIGEVPEGRSESGRRAHVPEATRESDDLVGY